MAIAAARTKVCSAVSGGLNSIWLMDEADLTSFTLTGEAYSAYTTTGSFYKFEFAQDLAEFRETGARENNSYQNTQEVEFAFTGLTQTDRDHIADIIDSSTCGIVAIVKDSDGVKWVVGYSENQGKERPLKLTSDTTLTGKGMTDSKGSTLVLSTTTNEKARTYTGADPS